MIKSVSVYKSGQERLRVSVNVSTLVCMCEGVYTCVSEGAFVHV